MMHNFNPNLHHENCPRHWRNQARQQGMYYDQQNQLGNYNMSYQAQMPRQIAMEDAMGIAREQVQGQVVKVELERKGGVLIYEVDIVNSQGVKYEVKIDATTGAVLEIELD